MKHFLKPLRAAVVAALGLAVLAGAAVSAPPVAGSNSARIGRSVANHPHRSRA